MPEQAPAVKSPQGLLTESGEQKICAAIQERDEGTPPTDASRKRSSYRAIATQGGIGVDEVIRILYRQKTTDLRAIKALFKAYQVRLQKTDYQIIRDQETETTTPAPPDLAAWEGRENLLTQLDREFLAGSPVFLLWGMGGMGKTTLAKKLTQLPQRLRDFPLLIWLDFEQEPLSFEAIARAVLGEGVTCNLQLEGKGRELLPATIAKLESQRIFLVLDSLETMLDNNGQFRDPLFESFYQLSPHITGRSRVLLISQTPPQTVPQIPRMLLKGLELENVQALFRAWGVQLSDERDLQCLEEIYQVYEGHPLTLKIIAGEICNYPYGGNIRAYWYDWGYEYEVTTEARFALKSLQDWTKAAIERSSQRLGTLSPLAYQVLCLGSFNAQGSYRKGWYFLMGELPSQEQEKALETLRSRFFLETENRSGEIYYQIPHFLRKILLNNLSATVTEVKASG